MAALTFNVVFEAAAGSVYAHVPDLPEVPKHEMRKNAAGQRTTVPRHREINTLTARGICRQFSVPPPTGS